MSPSEVLSYSNDFMHQEGFSSSQFVRGEKLGAIVADLPKLIDHALDGLVLVHGLQIADEIAT